MRSVWTFHSAGQLVFGNGAAALLGELAKRLAAQRILVVTDSAIAQAGLLEVVEQPLTAAGRQVEVFRGGEPEPALEVVDQAVLLAREFRPDCVLGLGGGSNMDLAKAVATMLAHGGGPRDYFGDDRIPGPVTDLICVPTTAGTGSEVSSASVLTDRENHIKVGILSNFLRPRLAVVDPLLTRGCPKKVTADSGIDALTHAIEAFTAVDNADFPLPVGQSVFQGRHPLGDCLAEKAISLIGAHLVRAVNHPDDLVAREGMALAATLAGLAFSNVGVALVHALEYPLGGATHCSHGAGNGLLLPFVMRFNLPARVTEFGRIATLLGRDTAGLDPQRAALEAVAAIEDLKRQIGIPNRLSDLGVTRDQLRAFAEKAFEVKRILRVNPRTVSVDDLEQILVSAL